MHIPFTIPGPQDFTTRPGQVLLCSEHHVSQKATYRPWVSNSHRVERLRCGLGCSQKPRRPVVDVKGEGTGRLWLDSWECRCAVQMVEGSSNAKVVLMLGLFFSEASSTTTLMQEPSQAEPFRTFHAQLGHARLPRHGLHCHQSAINCLHSAILGPMETIENVMIMNLQARRPFCLNNHDWKVDWL